MAPSTTWCALTRCGRVRQAPKPGLLAVSKLVTLALDVMLLRTFSSQYLAVKGTK